MSVLQSIHWPYAPAIRSVPHERAVCLVNDWSVFVSLNSKTHLLLIESGFKSDLFSVPWVFTRVFPKWDIGWEAAIIHDWLYINQPSWCSRKDADSVLYFVMLKLEVPKWRAWLKYKAVRFGGWQAWKRAKKELKST